MGRIEEKRMRIAIAGASGLIGSKLVSYWGSLGHEVHRLVRDAPSENTDIPWDPGLGHLARSQLEGFDAVVCLSGAGIVDQRWTPGRKDELRESRIRSVSLLAKTMADCVDKPECFISASATGYYGADRDAEVLTEDSAPGTDFIAKLCIDWEAAGQPAHAAGIRVVHTRTAVVLAQEGGALPKMLPVFKLGLGGRLGSGRQIMSWISIADVVSAFDFLLHADDVYGPVNLSSPNPITNAEFTKALGRTLRRPTVAFVPKFVLRHVLGEPADLLLGSNRAFPRRLESAGFQFRYPEMDLALESALK